MMATDTTADVTHGRRTYTKHPFTERIRAVELFSQGLSSNEVASRLGLDGSTVRAWVRKSRRYGPESLRPYWRPPGRGIAAPQTSRRGLDVRDPHFLEACLSYASSRVPASAIARRHGLDYHSFLYHLHRYYPELVSCRRYLKGKKQ